MRSYVIRSPISARRRWRTRDLALRTAPGVTPNWSAKVEYLYMDLGNRSFALTGNSLGLHANYLRFGVNYHF